MLLLPTTGSHAQDDMGQRGVRRTAKSPEEVLKELYTKRYAVVVGINKYANGGTTFPNLSAAVNDANRVAAKLRDLNFEVTILKDNEATKDMIIKTLSDKIGRKAKENDQVVFFFAGHGNTEDLPGESGKEGDNQMGYIIPHNYDPEYAYATSIAMNELRSISTRIKAKHVLYVMDSCFSGGIFQHRASNKEAEKSLTYLKTLTKDRVHMVLTAGAKNQTAKESGGSGLFTQAFLEGLSGEADLDHTGFITASELGLYIRRKIVQDLQVPDQTPQAGFLQGNGDVVLTMLRPLEEIVKENAPVPGAEEAAALRRQMLEERQKMEEWQKEQARLMDEQKRKMEAERVERERQAKLEQERLNQERGQARRELEQAEEELRQAEAAKRDAESSGGRRRSRRAGSGGF